MKDSARAATRRYGVDSLPTEIDGAFCAKFCARALKP